jgi:hypothetical protein
MALFLAFAGGRASWPALPRSVSADGIHRDCRALTSDYLTGLATIPRPPPVIGATCF